MTGAPRPVVSHVQLEERPYSTDLSWAIWTELKTYFDGHEHKSVWYSSRLAEGSAEAPWKMGTNGVEFVV